MKSNVLTCGALLFLSLSALAACGDGPEVSREGAGSCEEVAACGGDPTGSWTFDGLCVDPSIFAGIVEGCDSKYDASDFEMRGSVDFNADGTYVRTLTGAGSSTTTYSPGCPFTCEELDATVKMAVGPGDSDYESAQCAVVGEDCVCDVAVRERTTTQTGTWSVSGATLLTALDGEEPDGERFCAQGSSLTIGLSRRDQMNDAASPMTSYMRFTRR